MDDMDARPTKKTRVDDTVHQSPDVDLDRVIKLNIGGEKTIQTTRRTLQTCPGSMLDVMFSGRIGVAKDGDGNIFIDRDPKFFLPVLEYLRCNCRLSAEVLSASSEFQERLRYWRVILASAYLPALFFPLTKALLALNSVDRRQEFDYYNIPVPLELAPPGIVDPITPEDSFAVRLRFADHVDQDIDVKDSITHADCHVWVSLALRDQRRGDVGVLVSR
jgi:hypothetical protein